MEHITCEKLFKQQEYPFIALIRSIQSLSFKKFNIKLVYLLKNSLQPLQ